MASEIWKAVDADTGKVFFEAFLDNYTDQVFSDLILEAFPQGLYVWSILERRPKTKELVIKR